MTFAELLDYLGTHSGHEVLDGTPAETLEKAQGGTHRHPLLGQIVSSMFAKSGLASIDSDIDRATAVNSIGPIRLQFMRDDAPVDGFRLVEDIVRSIDGAFNEEALRLRDQS